MKITQEEVTHVANLSKLKFSPEETAEFATTLSKIVDMVELLEEVDTTGVAPTTTMADRKTVLRPDVAEKGTDRVSAGGHEDDERDPRPHGLRDRRSSDGQREPGRL